MSSQPQPRNGEAMNQASAAATDVPSTSLSVEEVLEAIADRLDSLEQHILMLLTASQQSGQADLDRKLLNQCVEARLYEMRLEKHLRWLDREKKRVRMERRRRQEKVAEAEEMARITRQIDEVYDDVDPRRYVLARAAEL